MVRHSPLHRNPKVYEDFYCSQGGNGLPVFIGGRNQRGHGIGSFFSGLGRMVLPWLKTGGKALLREGVNTGLQVANDALSGRNLGESIREHGRSAAKHLLHQATDHIRGSSQSGGGRNKRVRGAPPGEPLSKRIKTLQRQHIAHKNQHNKKKKHQSYSDIFA